VLRATFNANNPCLRQGTTHRKSRRTLKWSTAANTRGSSRVAERLDAGRAQIRMRRLQGLIAFFPTEAE